MDIKHLAKGLTVGLFAVLALLFTTTSALASHGPDPYDGVNRIGTYYQYTSTAQPMYASQVYAYDYIAPARAGGWYGWGTEYLVGLRGPMYTPIPPVRYTNYYQPVCGWPCWTGSYGYPRATAGDFPYRSRLGGAFSY